MPYTNYDGRIFSDPDSAHVWECGDDLERMIRDMPDFPDGVLYDDETGRLMATYMDGKLTRYDRSDT